MIGAIAAGNTVVIKPSELAPACSSFLYRVIPLYLDTEAIKVVEGGNDVAEKLLQQQWDKIFFTGYSSVMLYLYGSLERLSIAINESDNVSIQGVHV